MNYLRMWKIFDKFIEQKEDDNLAKIKSLSLHPEEEKEFIKFIRIHSNTRERIDPAKAEDFTLTEKDNELSAMIISYGIHNGLFPEVLFKYTSIENFIKSIKGNYLWFSQLDGLNDENESFDPINYKKMTGGEITSYYRHCKNKYEKPPPFPKERALKNYETKKKYLDIIKEMTMVTRRSVKILCLTLCSKMREMWEEYGEDGGGICMEINIMAYPQLFLIPEKVKYVEELVPDMTLMEARRNEEGRYKYIKKSVATKLMKWSHEKEYRVIKFYNPKNMQIFENKGIIRSVVFGYKCADDCIKEVVTVLKENNYPEEIEIRKMKDDLAGSDFLGVLKDI